MFRFVWTHIYIYRFQILKGFFSKARRIRLAFAVIRRCFNFNCRWYTNTFGRFREPHYIIRVREFITASTITLCSTYDIVVFRKDISYAFFTLRGRSHSLICVFLIHSDTLSRSSIHESNQCCSACVYVFVCGN